MNQSVLDCEEYVNSTSFPTSCNSLFWAVENRQCNPVAYTGSVCKEALLDWQNCIDRQTRLATIIISLSESQAELEEQAMQALDAISEWNNSTATLTWVLFVEVDTGKNNNQVHFFRQKYTGHTHNYNEL